MHSLPQGFIGSHTVLSLLESGCTVVIIDNLHNAHKEAFNRMVELAGPDQAKKMTYQILDLKDAAAMKGLFSANKFDVRMPQLP